MNIQKEIEKFSTLGYSALAEEFKKEADELRTKRYLFKTINALNELEELIRNDIFLAQGIKYIRIHHEDDLNAGLSIASVDILDENKKVLDKTSSSQFYKEHKLVSDLFGFYTFTLESDLCSIDFEKTYNDFELNNNTKKELRDYFLNEELRKAYNYIIMLGKNPEKTGKEKTIKRKI